MKKLNTLLDGMSFALIAGLSATSAHADASSATSEAKTSSLLDRVALRYDIDYEGGPLTRPLSGAKPDENSGGIGSSPVEMENAFTISYALSETIKADLITEWNIYPFREKGMSLEDPAARIKNSSLFTAGDLNVYADVRLYAPASQASRKATALPYLGTLQITSYKVPGSRLTLGAVTWAAGVIHRDRAVARAKEGWDLDLYIGPFFKYRISPTVAASATFDLGATHLVGQSGIGDVYNDLILTTSWDFSPGMNLSPYLNIQTGNRIALDSTQIGATFGWQLL